MRFTDESVYPCGFQAMIRLPLSATNISGCIKRVIISRSVNLPYPFTTPQKRLPSGAFLFFRG